MIKVMHLDTVFEVFIFKFFYFGYFFYARRGTYLMMVNFLKTLKPPISGESSTKMSYLGPPQIHDLTALNAGIRWERKSQISTNLEKNAPVMPTSPSNHVSGKLEL